MLTEQVRPLTAADPSERVRLPHGATSQWDTIDRNGDSNVAHTSVTRSKSYRDALQALRSAQKTSYGTPAYSRFVNRPVGRRIAAAAYAVGLRPNQVTAISGLLSLAAIILLATLPVGIPVGVLASLLLALGYAFDSADGQLARLSGTGGPGGEWLDHTVDMAKTVLVHGVVLIALLRSGGLLASQAALVIGFLTVSVVSFFSWLLADLLQRAAHVQVPHSRDSGTAPLLRSVLRLPSDYGLFLWIFLLWGTAAFWWAYALLFAANLVILLAALPVWYRQAAAAGAKVGS